MKKIFFGALGIALCAVALNAAAPPELARRTAKLGPVKAVGSDPDDIQDVLYVGQPHPVMMRLHLRVDRKSALANWSDRLEKLFNLIDRNGNKWLDRTEVARAPSVQQMLMYFQGNLYAVSNGRAGQQASVSIADVDTDRNGKVTLDEFKDYYRRNNAGPIAMQAQAAYYNPNGQSQADAAFEKLDTNKDGKLSKAELEAAEKTMLRFDRDDNELVSQQEIGLGTQSAYGRVVQVGQPRQPIAQQQSNLIIVARDSGKRMTNKLLAARELIKRYDKDKDDTLSREEVGFSKEMFKSIDRNDNGKLSALELARWLGGKPAGEFTVRLSDQNAMMARGGGRMPADKGALNDMNVNLEGVRINVVVQPSYSRSNSAYFTQIFKQLAGENKDFVTRKQLEGNRNTALYLRSLFDLGDRDNDSKLTEKEFKTALEGLMSLRGAQVSLSIFSTGNGLFQVLDANSDGQLSLREMRSAWKRLVAMDRDKDGFITRSEFPQQFQLSVSQGPSYGGGRLVGLGGLGGRLPRSGSAGRGPLWFRKMDRNGDGDVSKTEWLGTKDDFDAADADRDGLLSADEAEAYDAKMRNKAG